MQYIFDNLIIDINNLLINLDEKKKDLIQKFIIELITHSKDNQFKIHLISSNEKAKDILINNIAEDIDEEISISILDEKNFQNSWDIWKVENNISRKNSIMMITSYEFINFLEHDNLFSVFIDLYSNNNDIEDLVNKTSYKKIVELNNIFDELPNILFKLDSFLG